MAEEWGISEDALMAMEVAASSMEETMDEIKSEIEKLESAFMENESGLGAHSAEIQELIEELKRVGEEANSPVKKLVLKLLKSVMMRKAYIENNVISQVKRR